MVFQDPDEQLFMPTVLEDVAFGPMNLGRSREESAHAAEHALELVGMQQALLKAPYHLSEGEKRRVAIAGVLVMQPDILVLDEPTTFLDPRGQHELLDLLRGIPQAKLIVTHNTHFAEALASRAVFFENGRIAAEGAPAEVIRRFSWLPPE
jgi:energy-coupling factor transporter ATP-binding protein EcfA2